MNRDHASKWLCSEAIGCLARSRHLVRRNDLVAIGGILLQKSFCTGGQKFCGPPMRFSCKDAGASSPQIKLSRDLANASEAIRIGDCFPFRNFAKN
jgi:hypothetical protein